MRLTLEAVSKSYPTRTVLDAVSLDFPDVHALVFIGPSGGGKSTLLRLIAGLLEPTSGRLRLDGEPIPFHDPEALRQFRRRI
ncbi:MAG: ATP-binding cassette domain-containing protein, partial [Verrucomicrobiales bacterium]|nr:ATP-binding cassette domain-containing protein [Verrucomicrobiales bacterium]